MNFQYKSMQLQFTQSMLRQTEQNIFKTIGLKQAFDYVIQDIDINDDQKMHVIHIKSLNKSLNYKKFYMTHGFGGSSLFYFFLIPALREHGEIVLYDLRGMGFSSKKSYQQMNVQEIIKFFVEPIESIRRYFNHSKITMVGHSFGGYISMLYSQFFPNSVDKVKAFSVIGLTPKNQDYKNSVKNCSDCFNYIISQIGWKFQLTYKTLLKYCVCCCRTAAIRNSFSQFNNSQSMTQSLVSIILRLYQQPLGSETLFFKIFEPRVLPVFSLQEYYEKEKPKRQITIVYGQEDWVDQKGALYLKKLYPQQVKVITLQKISHQIFFYGSLQNQLIDLITE